MRLASPLSKAWRTPNQLASTQRKSGFLSEAAFAFGAGCRTRTRHLMITNQLLYQMS
jgi:hypothetical protein